MCNPGPLEGGFFDPFAVASFPFWSCCAFCGSVLAAGEAEGVDEEDEDEVADEEAEDVALGDATVMGFCGGPELMVRLTAAPRTAWVPACGF